MIDRSLSFYLSMYLCMYVSIYLSIHPPTLTLDSEDDYRTGCRNVSYLITVSNNSPIQDYVHPDDQTQPTFKTLFLVFDVKRSS